MAILFELGIQLYQQNKIKFREPELWVNQKPQRINNGISQSKKI